MSTLQYEIWYRHSMELCDMTLIDEQNWSETLKEKVKEFMSRNNIRHVHTILELIKLLNWAREEHPDCDSCERIDPEDAYDHVCENPPDPPWMP